ncbi:histidine kinase [Tsuneonella sp. YG55]|uniref:Histidine kinase n=1 Tax=Tsuneonella litorea TaxID=2976475 RepID=A0A9X2W2R3_9SPHN|nr:histidine kinase [Tsuneonella litorea]MCT2558910.1 histidine kinase [Tsuneonella litorea]
MLANSFRNRIARVIAALRFVLAAVFLVALAADPSQPTRYVPLGYALLIGYVLTSAILLRIAWISWWHDFRLSGPAFALDVTVFSLSVWFTENPAINFNSPFTAFFFFLMYAAALRWNWRITALSAVVTATAYLLAGIALQIQGQDIDIQVFLRRLSYMGVIAVALILFGMQSRSGRREPPSGDLVRFDRLEAAARYVARLLGARTVAIVWEPNEEPATAVILREGLRETHRLVEFPRQDQPLVQLFELSRGRCLALQSDDGRISVGNPPPDDGLMALADVDEGLCAALRSGQGSRGQLIAGDIDDLAVDDLSRFHEIAREVVSLIEERTLAEFERNRAIVQTREALARDVHDSVAQALAGATFGIEALRLTIPEDAQESRRLAADLKATLREEQTHIRGVIDRLRSGPSDTRKTDLAEELASAVEECRGRWGVEIRLADRGKSIIGAPLAFECRQIVREAVSNAVRHGGATCIEIEATAADGHLTLAIANDGTPFGEDEEKAQPRTIRERAERLGGRFAVQSGTPARIRVDLPLGRS